MAKLSVEGKNYIYKSCPLCNGSSFKPFLLQGGMDIVKCTWCSMVFKNPQPTEKFLEENINFEESQKREIKDCNAMNKAILQEIKKTGQKNLSLLDIDCCDSRLLSDLSLEGVDVHSVVRNSDIAESLKEETGLKSITVGNFDEISFSRKEIDVVLCRFSFERSFNPRETLMVAHRLLKENGRIIIVTNNLLNRRMTGKIWKGFSIPEQLFYYSPSSLRAILSEGRFSFNKVLSYPNFIVKNKVISQVNTLAANVSGLGYYLIATGLKRTINLKLTDLKKNESSVFVFAKPQVTQKNMKEKID
ncbi:MAG: methyltransferase domain-containing protein [Nitrospinae bacterium]|nr:methyltransferase domain-containing protein [Nitrospinota bacterium]